MLEKYQHARGFSTLTLTKVTIIESTCVYCDEKRPLLPSNAGSGMFAVWIIEYRLWAVSFSSTSATVCRGKTGDGWGEGGGRSERSNWYRRM